MTASKTLTAVIAAATIIGTVGYVSAQTTTATDPAPTTTTPSTIDTPASTGSNMSSPPVTSNVNAAEPAPKADRN